MSMVAGLNRKFQDYLAYESEHTRESVFFFVSPVIKLLTTIGFLIIVNYVITRPEIWLGLALILIFIALIFRINLHRFIRFELIMGIVYPLIIAVPQLFIVPGVQIWGFSWGPILIQISQEGFTVGLHYFLRIFATMTIIGFFIVSTPFHHIIHALRQLRIPSIFISLLTLTYRYFFFFFDNLVAVIQADATRHLQKLPFKARFLHLSNLFGNLMLRSMHQGMEVHRAMLARGYDGEFPILEFSMNLKRTVAYLFIMGSSISLALFIV